MIYHKECGTLISTSKVKEHMHQIVSLKGKLEKLNEHVILRDAEGIAQLIRRTNEELQPLLEIDTNEEYLINGRCLERIEGMWKPPFDQIAVIFVYWVKNSKNEYVFDPFVDKVNARLTTKTATNQETGRAIINTITKPETTRENYMDERTKRIYSSELSTDLIGSSVKMNGLFVDTKDDLLLLRDSVGIFIAIPAIQNFNVDRFARGCQTRGPMQIFGEIVPLQKNVADWDLIAKDVAIKFHGLHAMDPRPKNEQKAQTKNINVNSYTNRTHTCGELRDFHVGEHVTLCGWSDYFRVGTFLIIFDAYGSTQLIIPSDDLNIQRKVSNLHIESVITVQGTVKLRPTFNQIKTPTGLIEVHVECLHVINKAEVLPFYIRRNRVKEDSRMKYRYLTLRGGEMQTNLRLRSKILTNMRNFMVNEAGFVEIETPTLFRSTPGGAQEFVVPTRKPGYTYSLVQSPQQFKQLLMAGSLDRYFQIARCYRDEGGRPDRQPEFTQLDIEMSFTTDLSVMSLVEDLLKTSLSGVDLRIKTPFNSIPYAQAMDLYGTDKPDLTIHEKIIDCIDLFKMYPYAKETKHFAARGLVFNYKRPFIRKLVLTKFTDLAKDNSVYLVVGTVNDLPNAPYRKITKTDELVDNIISHFNMTSDSMLFLCYGRRQSVVKTLGVIRTEYVKDMEIDKVSLRLNELKFVWITDFPLFEEKDGSLQSVHHPFTAVRPRDAHLLQDDPLRARSMAYDLVLNGNEIGGGSIRIHRAAEQEAMFNMLQIEPEQFQYFLTALKSGCPSHGGIAIGIDRLMAILFKAETIRDVIAFPKGSEGQDVMSGAPVKISEKDRKLYSLSFDEKNAESPVEKSDDETQ